MTECFDYLDSLVADASYENWLVAKRLYSDGMRTGDFKGATKYGTDLINALLWAIEVDEIE